MKAKFAVADAFNGIFTEAFATEEEAESERIKVCEEIALGLVGVDYELTEDADFYDLSGLQRPILDEFREPIELTHTYETALKECLAFHKVVEIEEEEGFIYDYRNYH